MVEDQTFWQLTPDARKAAMKPVLDYAERQIKDRNSHHDWDELFPLTIAYADMIACYDKGQAYELIKQVLSADRALDTDINNGAQWSRLSCNYVAALECLQNRGYRKEFEDLFAEFMALSPDGGESDFRNKNIAWAHIAACDYYAGLKDFGKAESMARKALALRSDAELTGTIEQVRTYTKLCEQLHAQKKWKELLKEVNDGCGVSLYVMDAANDRYNTRQCRLKMARMAIDACKALGDQKQLDRYQRLEREEEQGTDIHRKINV
jgi:tetratricopeptide (TPR) repeat protein